MPAFAVPENTAFNDYPSLVAALNEWLDRDDLTGSAPTMIALAESRMRRLLDPYWNETTADIAAPEGTGVLPTDFGTPNRVIYSNRTLPQLGNAAGVSIPDNSEPYAYTLEANILRLWPSCSVTVTLLYQPTIAGISESSPYNALISKHPDLYFYGAMLFAEGYLANDERAARFKALWDEAIGEVKAYLTRQKFSGPLAPRVSFVP